MRRPRAARLAHVRAQRKRAVLTATLMVVAVAAIAGGLTVAFHGRGAVQASTSPVIVPVDSTSTVETSQAAVEVTSTPTAVIEVPSVVGQDVTSAGKLLKAAGFTVSTKESSATSAKAGRVITQDPKAGVKTNSGTEIVLVYAAKQVSEAAQVSASGVVVCLDPGHQTHGNSALEAIGPDSSTTKAKVSGGASGTATKQTEYAFNLAVALKVRTRLQAAGIKVVMTRTTNDVDISNIQRAQIGNKAKATLAVRIHADGNNDHSVNGVSTLYPSGNGWVSSIKSKSLLAAKLVQAAVVKSTGAADRGLSARSDLTGFNWSSVPVCLVECGFLSNAAEDRLLASSAYQDKIAAGIASGIITYVKL